MTKHLFMMALLKHVIFTLDARFLLIISNQDSWGVPLTPMVVHHQISLLVGVSLLTMYLTFFMWSIYSVSLQ